MAPEKEFAPEFKFLTVSNCDCSSNVTLTYQSCMRFYAFRVIIRIDKDESEIESTRYSA